MNNRIPKLIPMLFSSPMIHAIKADLKTQTRRVIEDSRILNHPEAQCVGFTDYDTLVHFKMKGEATFFAGRRAKYLVGDVLWVRETWQPFDGRFSRYVFKADAREIEGVPGVWWRNEKGVDLPCLGKWKSSIHMPLEACRFFLRIKEVRVERLQVISDTDAIAEGIEYNDPFYTDYRYKDKNGFMEGPFAYNSPGISLYNATAAVASYATLWESINGVGSWEKNPFVWVVVFERIEKPVDLIAQRKASKERWLV